MCITRYADRLEDLYRRYNRRRFVHPDPLEFIYAYDDARDREVAALIASSLAYGRMAQILRSVSGVLERLGANPAARLRRSGPRDLRRMFAGFRHRFATDKELCALLEGAGEVLRRFGSLEACFAAGDDGGQTVISGLSAMVSCLDGDGRAGHLLPDPLKGSACKRLHLFLRWMVRKDRVDPGVWRCVSRARLLVPVDTHMHRIARALGATQRKSADLRTALELTDAFRRIRPADPVRYDFALTRLGIRADADPDDWLERS